MLYETLDFVSLSADPVADTSVMDKLLTGAETAIEFSGRCLTAMVENPIYLFYLAAGLVGVGLALVSKLRGTARG